MTRGPDCSAVEAVTDGISINRLVPLGSIHSDEVAVARVFRVLFARDLFSLSTTCSRQALALAG